MGWFFLLPIIPLSKFVGVIQKDENLYICYIVGMLEKKNKYNLSQYESASIIYTYNFNQNKNNLGKLHSPPLRFIKKTVRPPLVLKLTLTSLKFLSNKQTPPFYINTVISPSNCLFFERAITCPLALHFHICYRLKHLFSHNERPDQRSC
jgi:hypothetical protein